MRRQGEGQFNGLKVGQDAFFDNAAFKGPVNFVTADIGGHFSARGAKFESTEHKADFSGLKVGRSAFFDNAVFKGPVDFATADIGGQFSASEAKFESTEHEANFNGLKVGQSASLTTPSSRGRWISSRRTSAGISAPRGRSFEGQGEARGQLQRPEGGPKRFLHDKPSSRGRCISSRRTSAGQFGAQEARFESTEHQADLQRPEGGPERLLHKAVFKGPVDFVTADIGGQFGAHGARFESTEHKATSSGLRVGQSALFLDVTCRSEVDLTYGTFLDLYFQGAREEKQDEAGSRVTLDLTGTHIQRELAVTDLKLKSLEAGHLRVKGPATFERLIIKEKADFQNASIETLKFAGITWPEQPEDLKLDGLTYTSLCMDGPDNFDGALGLVARSAFNPQNYGQLEDFCKRRGHPDWADTVSIAMKDRELDQRVWYVRWLKKLLWGWPAGYGRKPMRLLVASLIIILVGAALFNPQYLAKDKNPLKSSLPPDPEYAVEDKNPTQGGKLRVGLLRFLISLDQFLPAVNLGLADHWKAKDAHFLVWLFFTVEQGFGWIFVSIALAALYTQIK